MISKHFFCRMVPSRRIYGGINLYPELDDEDFIEFDSLINIRPRQGNMSRDVENENIRAQIKVVVERWIK